MKNLLLTIVALLALVACEKEGPKLTLDPYAQLAINASFSKTMPEAPYSMDTVVRYAFGIKYWSDAYNSASRQPVMSRDLKNLKFWVGETQDVVAIDSEGEPKLGYMLSENLRDMVVIAVRPSQDHNRWIDAYVYWDMKTYKPGFSEIHDTIGYVPNRVVKAAEAEIHKAFNEGNYELCVKLFETAYVFEPITGPEWRALKAQGLN